ncbi:hypothetical protein H2201_005407 [Coniosporium apollinis]|uniref:Thioesterase domain-containing protein n=1 Tax=Coniosporium apollinis TaxID=61459 RepID=A0ABQ9NS08_9PEZI|nr:hypothetical protein H2201_005407 [Coniosporium apollinis]
MTDQDARKKAMAAVRAIYHRIAATRPSGHLDFDHEVMKSVKLIDAGPEGSVVYELLITPSFSNLNDVMHGGAAGVIFDMCTTTALCPLASPGFWEFMGGVTRTLNISYLKAVPIGTTVRINSVVMQAGKTMAMIRAEMTSVDGKVIYCTCEHHKVNVPSQAKHLAVRIPWDEEQEAAKKAARKANEKVNQTAKL